MIGRVLGLDGGGTKTITVVANTTGEVLAYDVSDALDPTAGPNWEQTLTSIASHMSPVDAAVLGLPYHGEISAISSRQTALGAALFGAQCHVMNDVAVAFEGAFGGGNGVLILSGTGSMAWARGPAGDVRVGGWGHAFGDEGSAYAIGRAALATVSKHLDGRQDCTDFATQLLQRLGVAPDGLIAWAHDQTGPRSAIASVAREVSALADAGVSDAKDLMQAAALQLAEQAHAAARLSNAEPPLQWSYAGGVMHDKTLLAALSQGIGIAPQTALLPPVGGAVLAAARMAGLAVTPSFVTKLSAALTAAAHALQAAL